MRILVPIISIVLGLSMVSSTSAANVPRNRVARIRRTVAPSVDSHNPSQAHHRHHQQQYQEVHSNSIAHVRRRFSLDNNSHRLLRKRAQPAQRPGRSGTVVGGILEGNNKAVVVDTSPDPADQPKSKPNSNEIPVGEVFEKKLVDVKTPGAAAPANGPSSPIVKLNTENHNIVETTLPNTKGGPVGTGNQQPPPTP